MAAEGSSNPLVELSAALAALVAAVTPRAVGVRAKGAPPLTGTLWRPDVVVASEQVFPDVGEAEILHSSGAMSRARVTGRDPGTNVVALRLDTSVEIGPPASAEPRHGGLALVLSAGLGGPQARLGLVSRLGPAWVSRAGGQIDRHIGLDLVIGARGEGGPVFDAAGSLLGISTAGPDRRGLVIPVATIDRVIEPLLATGRIARGWLGLAMQPIALDDDLAAQSVETLGHRAGDLPADDDSRRRRRFVQSADDRQFVKERHQRRIEHIEVGHRRRLERIGNGMAAFLESRSQVAVGQWRSAKISTVDALDDLRPQSRPAKLPDAESAGEILECASVPGVPKDDLHGTLHKRG